MRVWPRSPGGAGSSPRTWGTLLQSFAARPAQRFIPTHVGNAARSTRSRMRPAVHPHARGERCSMSVRRRYRRGSSPRTWGTPRAQGKQDARRRFIPTHVGNAALGRSATPDPTVHPHARGERTQQAAHPGDMFGSSPRTWGTPMAGHRLLERGRFIPTHVGNASAKATRPTCLAVHPHARGERDRAHRAATRGQGSSPRPWGTPGAGGTRIAGRRFIPTPVGNAAQARRCASRGAVHPHARGERNSFFIDFSEQDGSSPRPWGTHAPLFRQQRDGRFIPTPVGNAVSLIFFAASWAVHPHARGERVMRDDRDYWRTGSSPRPWGTH